MIRHMAIALFGLLAACAFADDNLWSLRPVAAVDVPKPKASASTDIDRFLLAKLEAKGLSFGSQADSRTQVRRLYFDLIGLPPPPRVVEAFSENPTEAAYEKLVDDLLASPHYGERMARLWLDLVRYGESDGFERNAPRERAWPYRDWVIAAFNGDMPYDRFAALQLAGDVLEPNDPGSIAATGFLVAGLHNTVVGSNPIMQQNARQDELEDLVAAVSQSFLGLSAQCARCHDHKFDPIVQTDYYRLAAALAGVTHGERSVPVRAIPAAAAKKLGELDSKLRKLAEVARQRVAAKRTDKIPLLVVTPRHRWSFAKDATDSFGGLPGKLEGDAKVANGKLVLPGKNAYASTGDLGSTIREKTLEAWVSPANLDQRGGGVLGIESAGTGRFDAIVFGERQPKLWMAGSDNFRRTRDLKAKDETAESGEFVHVAIAYAADGSIRLYRNGKPYADAYTPSDQPLQEFAAKQSRVLFGLRHTGAGNGHFYGEIDEARLYESALSADDIAASFAAGADASAIGPKEILAELTASEVKDRTNWEKERLELQSVLPMPGPDRVFAVVSQMPPEIHVLARGNVERKKDLVSAGGIAALPGDSDFGLKPSAAEGDRRKKLAEWIVRKENPLFARVMVNRLWQQHFGIGLVETPSDFGKNGSKPSHPELLDWLAGRFSEKKLSLKAIHKLVVTTAAYRQSSMAKPAANRLDDDNRLLWRKSIVRLEAEMLRDSILSASGLLNLAAGGPGYRDVNPYGDAGTTYYEPIDPDGPEFQRRTIYRFAPRGERSALLEMFDCPDPSAQTPRRQTTTTPLQALALWNDSLVLRASDAFAKRVEDEPTAEAKATAMFRLALGRSPSADELKLVGPVVEKHGAKALARVLFNSSEFAVIE